ncbi:hypothetical protein DSO57_1035992 [Entomophthora muscae]|uniref:Uncharacterized protein n=2 Tax=Entomophthora muscae TaxID=34485 RepID=A0ACC2SN11_9FUNG|nr:hypothetical protein DSO57_1037839 [Entomophthora muscae]KAJ9079383.1 hypothetical protein DSO57_1035992 [Entomophthora muscae]
MFKLISVVGRCLSFEVESGELFGRVVKSPTSYYSNEEEGMELNLVNSITARSEIHRPMILATELLWVGTSDGFSIVHARNEGGSAPRKCVYGAVGCSLLCFSSIGAYYTWSGGMPVSRSAMCNIDAKCQASPEWTVASHVKTSYGRIPAHRLMQLFTNNNRNIPVPVAKTSNSPEKFTIDFKGLNRKRMMFKAMYYTIQAELTCSDPRKRVLNATADQVTLSLPMIHPGSGESDGLFYLEDA